MSFPDFYASVPRLRLRDPLAGLLGASADGILDYGYVDAVRLAGHSCPTVAAAYWLTWRALALLYGTALPVRGEIRVSFRLPRDEGVTGVTAAVVGLLTGAAGSEGFKGLGGRYARRGLLNFASTIPLDLRFERLDTGARVDAAAYPQQVPADPALSDLLAAVTFGTADAAARQRFGEIWQDRVARLLSEYRDDPAVFDLRLA
jgi:hypothetical protein